MAIVASRVASMLQRKLSARCTAHRVERLERLASAAADSQLDQSSLAQGDCGSQWTRTLATLPRARGAGMDRKPHVDVSQVIDAGGALPARQWPTSTLFMIAALPAAVGGVAAGSLAAVLKPSRPRERP